MTAKYPNFTDILYFFIVYKMCVDKILLNLTKNAVFPKLLANARISCNKRAYEFIYFWI